MPSFLSPEEKKNAQMQGLLGVASGLLDASGPSLVPRSLGQGLSKGLTAGMAAMNNAQQQAMQRQAFGMQKDRLDLQRAAAERAARAPIEVNGVLVDPQTYQPVADFRQPKKPIPFEVKLEAIKSANPGISDSEAVKMAMSPSTVINNTGPAPQTEEQKAIGRAYADQFVTIQQAAESARNQISALDQFESGSGSFTTGPFAGTRVLLGRTAQFFGIDPEDIGIDGVADAESMRAVSNRLAKSMRVQGEGVMSDADLRLLIESVVSIDNTPEGNRKLAFAMRKVAERTILKEQMANAWYDEKQTMRGFSAEWNKYERENPLFADGELDPAKPIPVSDDLYGEYGLEPPNG